MTVDLTRLLEPLATAATAELDALDERLLAIDGHAAKGRFDEAAQACARLWDDDIFDIRPLPYALHCAFLDGGVPGLAVALRVLDNLLGASRTALMPAKRQESLVNKRLAWLFDTTEEAIRYHREQRTARWDQISSTLSEAALNEALAACERLSPHLASDVTADALRALGQLVATLRGLREGQPVEVVSPAPAAAATPAPEPTPTPSPCEPLPEAVPDTTERPGLTPMQLRVGQPFVELCRQLSAAQTLLKKKDYLKAAVVLEMVNRAIEGFDPRACFPELFAPFAAMVAHSAHALEEAGTAQGSPVWQALAQYAKVDLGGFVGTKS